MPLQAIRVIVLNLLCSAKLLIYKIVEHYDGRQYRVLSADELGEHSLGLFRTRGFAQDQTIDEYDGIRRDREPARSGSGFGFGAGHALDIGFWVFLAEATLIDVRWFDLEHQPEAAQNL